MRLTRFFLIILLVVALGGAPAWPSGRVSAAEGWTPLAGQPAAGTAREAVALADGSVLLTGGGGEGGDAFASAVRFDPATGAWRRAADMLTPRFGHTITLLVDGRVLVAGGFTIGRLVDAAEVYDPVADTWRATGRLTTARARHFAALLPDGRVLVGGGYAGDLYTPSVPLGSTEIYDPATGHWSPAAPMRTGRGGRLASRLPDGMVLVTGGDGDRDDAAVAAAERYDPTTGRWLDTAPPLAARAGHIAVALGDGSILLAGGYSGVNDGSARPLTTAERYLPTGDRWMAAGTTPTALVAGVAAPLPDGGALVVGVRLDDTGRGAGLAAARYDPLADSWAPLAPPPGFSGVRTSTALPDGRVLVTGNYRDPRSTVQGPPGATTAALFDGGVPARVCFAETGQCVRGRFLEYWEAHGGLALNGYPLSEEFEQRLEDGTIYTVQYFERVRLEYHPENPPPYDVLLGQFGRHILARVPGAPAAPVAVQPGATHFPETDHNVDPRFMAYWQATGGLLQFGYPLSELFEERLEDGEVYLVQYFERARFEYHPEHDPPYQVLLGQFGRRILAETTR